MGVSGQRYAPAALLPPVTIVQEAGWAPEPVWTQRLEEKSFVPAGDRTPVVQPVVRHYTVWATPAPDVLWGVPKTINQKTRLNSLGKGLLNYGLPHKRREMLIIQFRCVVGKKVCGTQIYGHSFMFSMIL
jgi:hypothetical protein